MWHFARSRTAKLQTDSSSVGSGSRISTYGTIVELLWKVITLANLPFLKPALSKATMAGRGVSARNMMQPA